VSLDTPTRWELDPAAADVDLATAELEGEAYHALMADLRSRHRVAPVVVFGQPAWLVLGFDELKDFCRRDADFPGGVSYAVNTEPIVGRTFISMDGAEHDVYRQLAMPAFRSRPISRYVDEGLVPLVHEVLDRFADRGEADLVEAFTGVLPFWSISRKLGLPYGSEEDQRRWSRDMLQLGWDPDGARRAADEFTAFMLPILEERRAHPQDDVLSHLLSAEYKGVRLDDDDIVSHVRLIYAVGATTTQDGLGNVLSTLLHRPAALARVAADRSLVPAAVHEMLRFEPPVPMNPRIATDPGRIGDVVVPAGANVMMGIAGANRDPRAFERPDEFDLDRRETDVMTFGFGPKFCPGYHLARAQIAAGLDAVLARLPGLRLVDPEGSLPRGAILRAPAALHVAWDRTAV
jgi:cytochrome P450